jgi:hypothetical protein
MSKSKEPFSIGNRVRHATDKVCNEGVVVWKHADYTGVLSNMAGKVWSVHWSNGKRGIYASEEIQRIPPKNVKKIVESQLDPEDIVSDEEK